MSSQAGTSAEVDARLPPGPYGPSGRSAWMDVDWRAHRRFVEVDGRRVNVVEIGAGEPAVVSSTASPARGRTGSRSGSCS